MTGGFHPTALLLIIFRTACDTAVVYFFLSMCVIQSSSSPRVFYLVSHKHPATCSSIVKREACVMFN